MSWTLEVAFCMLKHTLEVLLRQWRHPQEGGKINKLLVQIGLQAMVAEHIEAHVFLRQPSCVPRLPVLDVPIRVGLPGCQMLQIYAK